MFWRINTLLLHKHRGTSLANWIKSMWIKCLWCKSSASFYWQLGNKFEMCSASYWNYCGLCSNCSPSISREIRRCKSNAIENWVPQSPMVDLHFVIISFFLGQRNGYTRSMLFAYVGHQRPRKTFWSQRMVAVRKSQYQDVLMLLKSPLTGKDIRSSFPYQL